jgi:hypothetical protein
MSVQRPIEITRDNDLTLSIGPITGRDPADGTVKNYPGSQISGWIAAAEDSDTALGTGKTFNVIGTTATFVPFFDAPEVNAALDDAGTPDALVPGQILWCVLKGTGEFRIAVPLVYRAARRAA